MLPRVSINIVAWNSMEYLPDLLRSIFNQTYRDFSVRVIDNASSDGVEAYLRDNYPEVTVIRNARNLGFGGAHNQGIRFSIDKWQGENLNERYVLVTNPDIILTPTFLEEMMKEADAHREAGSFGGKLLRAFGENLNDEVFKDTVHSELIDSTGLRGNRRRWFAERGAGEMDTGQYDSDVDVFGVSGALALYRASALQDVKIGEEYFDADFLAYKEDIDIAWRLQALGWKSRYVPGAVAYHYRGMYGKEAMGIIERMKNRRGNSRRRSYYSTRNHWCMLMKNVSFAEGLLASPWIMPSELVRLAYVAVFEPENIGAIFETVRWAPKMMKKRRQVLKSRKVPVSEISKWFAGRKGKV